MNRYRSIYIQAIALSFLMLSIGLPAAFSQNKTVKTKAPKQEDRRPPSELMAAKKFTLKRRLFQNMATRYNYYFHARTKLNTLVKNVGQQGQDNYGYLLPFYPFNMQNLGINKGELDSIIEKASIAIQLHDPRGKWIDDCFLLMGRAYFYQGDYENANKTFQYINTTYAPRKKSDYKAVIGSSQNDQLTIASHEKRKGFIGRFKHIYARNDAFIWRAKTLLEQKEFDEVQALLNILETDPNFPPRLEGDLAEVLAYSRYKRGRFSEVTAPLLIAIDKSRDKTAKARMAYIAGQIYSQYNKPDSAIQLFREVIRLKADPMMDFQARLQVAQLNTLAKGGSAEQSIAALQHMLKKDKFERFRDVIYYTLAKLAAPNDPEAAIGYLQKSLKEENSTVVQKTLSFKSMADIYYNQRKYREAKNYYDSTALSMGPDFADTAVVNVRKNVLTAVAEKVGIIHREDSLQGIAAMPEAARTALLEQMAASFKKTATDKKNDKTMREANPFDNPNAGAAFAPKEEKGDWYFYNQASKTTGYGEFKKRWGNRALADNWRRSQNGSVALSNNTQPGEITVNGAVEPTVETVAPDSITAELLAKDLPLTPEKLTASRNTEMEAWFDLGKLYHDKLDNNKLAIETYDSLLLKFPDHPKKAEVLYSLYVWYNKMNNTAKANEYKQLVLTQYGNTNFANIIQFGNLKDVDDDKKKAITAAYNSAYTAFKSGDYPGALAQKRQADSTFGLNFLQPKFDLLEAMVIVKTDTANLGKAAVQQVINKYQGDAPIRNQAQTLMDALNHKDSLVNYLASLQVRARDTSKTALDEDVTMLYPWQRPNPNLADAVKVHTATVDSVKIATNVGAPTPLVPVKPVTPYKLNAANPHFVVLSFKRVAKVLMDEGLEQFTRYNANKHPNDKIEVGTFVLSEGQIMLIFRLFSDENKALDYFDEIRDLATTNIIPKIRPTDYSMFVISRDNFILLNSTKDLTGYEKFFSTNYVVE
jgi:tetratricopeptide (TPR) repeat protein